ncbi:MAG: hypothetical protein ACKVP3_21680 [Hyphomicrobiaceae bacterium]
MEIITGVERRQRWRPEQKLRILAELEEPGATVADLPPPGECSVIRDPDFRQGGCGVQLCEDRRRTLSPSSR